MESNFETGLRRLVHQARKNADFTEAEQVFAKRYKKAFAINALVHRFYTQNNLSNISTFKSIIIRGEAEDFFKVIKTDHWNKKHSPLHFIDFHAYASAWKDKSSKYEFSVWLKLCMMDCKDIGTQVRDFVIDSLKEEIPGLLVKSKLVEGLYHLSFDIDEDDWDALYALACDRHDIDPAFQKQYFIEEYTRHNTVNI